MGRRLRLGVLAVEPGPDSGGVATAAFDALRAKTRNTGIGRVHDAIERLVNLPQALRSVLDR